MAATGTDEVTPGQHNALAWLNLTDRELVERSASLGLPGNLAVPTAEGGLPDGGVMATLGQVAEARKAADEHARSHAGVRWVNAWIKANRGDPLLPEATPFIPEG